VNLNYYLQSERSIYIKFSGRNADTTTTQLMHSISLQDSIDIIYENYLRGITRYYH
jgi:uncharacterized membrane protein YcgQ (UPF0703/DUF1980 family)